jgi:hypothetical protein
MRRRMRRHTAILFGTWMYCSLFSAEGVSQKQEIQNEPQLIVDHVQMTLTCADLEWMQGARDESRKEYWHGSKSFKSANPRISIISYPIIIMIIVVATEYRLEVYLLKFRNITNCNRLPPIKILPVPNRGHQPQS